MKLPKALNEATAGAALKYHIKRALERSHSISEFSKQLDLSAKNAKFSNNTLKIIEELNNGVKSASEEIHKEVKEKATKYEKALQELQKIDESKLTKEQKQVLKVFKGELDQTEIKGIDLNDLYILEQGSRNAGARKILRKHYGVENTGGLTNDELINMSEVIKNGSVLLESFKRINEGFRYAYEWENNGVKLRLVVDDLNNGNKIFDFYSDRNFTDFRDASLHSGNHPYENNPTPKPATSQEDLLKTSENLNETTPKPTNLSPLEQANAKKLLKLQHATTPLKEFGTNYPEFALKPKEALEKLLQERNGQVAGAAYRDDLGGIDFVWGTPKTKESVGYGLAHVLERREQQALADGLSEAEAKEYAVNIVKSIPEVLEKGTKGTDHLGRVFVDYGNKRVGLNNTWNNKDLENHWVISSYELRDTTEKPTHFPTSQAITKEKDIHSLNSVGPNPTINALKTQEHLSPLEQANAKKLLKLQHATTPLKEFGTNYPEFALKPKEALEKLLQERNGQVAGAAYRDDLGGIDFVWGTPKTKESVGYGLAHIIESREKQYKKLGLTPEQVKERTNELIKEIPNIIQKGLKEEDRPGYVAIILNNSKVILSKFKGDNELKNHYMITSFEVDEKVLRELETIAPLPNDYRDGGSISNLNRDNPTKKPLNSQEDLLKNTENLNETTQEAKNLSPLEQAEAEKL
ncbi:DUF3519 domain-containing protein, partial [Helicobacter pylori]|nr:DUF3519 domain-containing protein [Helicobacter pylori]